MARAIICCVPEPELRMKYSDGSVYGADLSSVVPRPSTWWPIDAEIDCSDDVAGTTNAIGWIGPRYSAICEVGAYCALHELANTSDAPTSSVVPAPNVHATGASS